MLPYSVWEMKDKFRKNKKTKENAFKVLTEKSGYGKLDVALSKKQSRVSTLTIAQARDYGLITKNFLSDFPKWFY